MGRILQISDSQAKSKAQTTPIIKHPQSSEAISSLLNTEKAKLQENEVFAAAAECSALSSRLPTYRESIYRI